MTPCCATCVHAHAIDPTGYWTRNGMFDHGTYTHCRLSPYGEAQVMAKLAPCTFDPPRWEQNERSRT